jgi:hypothetical protein
MTQREMENTVKNKYWDKLAIFMEENGFVQFGDFEAGMYEQIDKDGTEQIITISLSTPRKRDGEDFSLFEERDNWIFEQKQRQIKQEARELKQKAAQEEKQKKRANKRQPKEMEEIVKRRQATAPEQEPKS